MSTKIILLALSIKGAMGQYIHCLMTNLNKKCDISLYCPDHYEFKNESYKKSLFRTGPNKMTAGISLLNIKRALRLANKIVSEKPSIVHILSGEGYPWAIIVSYLLFKSKVPFLMTIHDPRPHYRDFFGIINNWLRNFSIKMATLIHVHSNNAKILMEKKGIPSSKIKIIPHGIFKEIFEKYLNEDEIINNNNFKKDGVLFFGRIERYKGLDVYLKAAQILGDKFTYIIAGPGNFSKKENSLLKKLPMERFKIINRYLENYEIPGLFKRSLVTVLPYRDASQSSIPFISAMFGVPTVASAVGAFLEDIPEVNGILVKPNDPYSLANGILDAIKRKPIYPVEREFKYLAPKFLELYNEAENRM